MGGIKTLVEAEVGVGVGVAVAVVVTVAVAVAAGVGVGVGAAVGIGVGIEAGVGATTSFFSSTGGANFSNFGGATLTEMGWETTCLPSSSLKLNVKVKSSVETGRRLMETLLVFGSEELGSSVIVKRTSLVK